MRRAVTFYCGGKLVPASRFRVYPIAERLQAEGWPVSVKHGYGALDQSISNATLRKGYRAACRLVRGLRTAAQSPRHPVVLQRLALPWTSVPELILSHRGAPIVFDFDDAVFLGTTSIGTYLRQSALKGIFENAAHIVAGNSWLAEKVGTARPVTVIPTCINSEFYKPPGVRVSHDPIRIGWIGTGSNFPYLLQLVEPLKRLRSAGFEFKFVICSDSRDERLFHALGADFCRWSADRELDFLQSLDIGLMPLDGDDWCKGKCSFKLIQYMSTGCPVVASAVGFNNDVVSTGEDGFLIEDNDWYSPLQALMTSEALRHKMGSAARLKVVRNFDISVAVEGYRAILESL